MKTAIFALGSNGSGQLGVGHQEDVSVPKPVSIVNQIVPAVQRIAAGGKHTLILTTAGEIFCSGDPTTGACGPMTPVDAQDQVAMESDKACQFRPFDLSHLSSPETPSSPSQDYRSPAPVVVTHVAATWEATILAVRDRTDPDEGGTRVYSCGLGARGELGQGSLVVRTPRPSKLASFPPPGTAVIDLAACVGHVVAVLDNGEAWGWGGGRKGQLGAPEDAIVDRPRRIEGIGFPVRRAVCGREFTCLLGGEDHGDRVLVLGSDKGRVRSDAPDSLPGWRDVGAGWGGICVLLADDSLRCWGRDEHGQVTLAEKSRVKKMAVGSEHALALTEDGDVVAWGWGEHGNCGPGNTSAATGGTRNVIASSKYIPPGSEITHVGAGCATSWISIEMPS